MAFRGFALEELRSTYDVDEAVYLSTCNRSELILWTRSGFSPRRVLRRWREWAARGGQPLASALSSAGDLTLREGEEAARYLFNVASSLDSLVVGETEILRQLREALTFSLRGGHAGPNLRVILDRSLKTGREVRQRTALASVSTSVVSVALKEIRRLMAGRPLQRALVIGAGDTGRAVARTLRSLGAKTIAIANRTVARAEGLAESVRGRAFPLTEIPNLIPGADVVVSAVASPRAIITPELLGKARSPILLVDLGIPANIDPACAQCPNTTLLALPDLQALAEANRPLLDREAQLAARYVEDGLTALQGDFARARLSPRLRRTREAMLELASREAASLQAALTTHLGTLSPELRQLLEQHVDLLARRLAHIALEEMKTPTRASKQHRVDRPQ
jgi:glutamyl-tRNA reductase